MRSLDVSANAWCKRSASRTDLFRTPLRIWASVSPCDESVYQYLEMRQGQTYDQIARFLDHLSCKVLAILTLKDPQDLGKMFVASYDDDVDHRCLSALLSSQGTVEVLHISAYELDGEFVALRHASFFQSK